MIPKYEKIKQQIIDEIKKEVFKPGDRIYSEGELKNKFEVSSTTAVKALNELVMDGYLVRKQGIGTFVRKNLFHRPVYINEQTLVHTDEGHLEEALKTFTFDHIENTKISEVLEQGTLFKVIQISLINNHPWKVQIRYVASKNLTEESKARIKNDGSLSEELGYPDNLINSPTEMNIQADTFNANHPLIADLKDEIKTLIGNKAYAALKISRLVRNSEGQPIEFDIRLIDSDYYKLSIYTKHT